MNAHLWIKALHVVFVIAWFAGVFYLSRIFVNLAGVDDVATRERLLPMARKLLRSSRPAATRTLRAGSGGSMRLRCCCSLESSRWPLSNHSEDAI
jgi:uncharacterized membrane protein